nr:nuclear transport factor 2 family protein [Pyrinomonadaceae bacterium]
THCGSPRVSKGETLIVCENRSIRRHETDKIRALSVSPLLTRGLLQYGLILVLTLLTAISSSAQTRERTTGKPKTAEQEVRAVITRWATAVKNRDTGALDSIFAGDLFITDFNGGTRTKSQELDILKPSPTTKAMSVTNEDLKIKTWPRSAVAVATAKVRMVHRTAGRDSTMHMRYTSIWEKRGGRWQLTVLQTSRIPNK